MHNHFKTTQLLLELSKALLIIPTLNIITSIFNLCTRVLFHVGTALTLELKYEATRRCSVYYYYYLIFRYLLVYNYIEKNYFYSFLVTTTQRIIISPTCYYIILYNVLCIGKRRGTVSKTNNIII